MTNGVEISTPCIYRIRVCGVLESRWSGWFDGFTIRAGAENQTTLTGQVIDQSALHGLLAKICELGLLLLSVELLSFADESWQTKYGRKE